MMASWKAPGKKILVEDGDTTVDSADTLYYVSQGDSLSSRRDDAYSWVWLQLAVFYYSNLSSTMIVNFCAEIYLEIPP